MGIEVSYSFLESHRIYLGYIEIVEFLLDRGADIEAKDKKGDTVLLAASRKGYKDIVKLLLDKGADIEVRNDKKDTALSIALYNADREIGQLILDSGATISMETYNRLNYLMKNKKIKIY